MYWGRVKDPISLYLPSLAFPCNALCRELRIPYLCIYPTWPPDLSTNHWKPDIEMSNSRIDLGTSGSLGGCCGDPHSSTHGYYFNVVGFIPDPHYLLSLLCISAMHDVLGRVKDPISLHLPNLAPWPKHIPLEVWHLKWTTSVEFIL